MARKKQQWAGEIFGERLRQLRELRGLTQAELADRATALGTPLNRAAVLEIERAGRRLSIEEALALAWALQGVLVQLLTPPSGELLALTNSVAVDAAGLTNFVLFGDPVLAAPATVDDEQTSAVARARVDRALVRHAQALADAAHANDAHGITVAATAIIDAVRTYNAEVNQDG